MDIKFLNYYHSFEKKSLYNDITASVEQSNGITQGSL